MISGDFTDDQKWNLVAISIDKVGSTSPFVEKIVGDLADNGYEKAIEQLKKWSCEPAYFAKPPFFGSYLITTIEKMLDSSPDVAVSLYENLLVSNDYFARGSTRFDLDEVGELLSKIIIQGIRDGWRIWNELCQKKDLTPNQQQLVTRSLLSVSKTSDAATVKKAFVMAGVLTSDYEEFVSKFTDAYSRELVLQFVEKCAAKPIFDPIESFEIIKRFVKDPDPSTENSLEDTRSEFNYHKQIIEGKNPILITSVRGWVPWAIQQVVRVGIEEKIDQVIELTRNLTKDKNLYVRLQSCVALTRLAQTRNSEITDGKRFMSKEQAKKIEDTAFEMLHDPENKRIALQQAMVIVFQHLKLVDFECAIEAVNYFVHADFEALRAYLSAIIYFAELAEDFTPEQKLKFRNVLFRLIETDSEAKSAIALQMWSFSKVKSVTGASYLGKTLKYVRKIVQVYEKNAFDNIYSLIRDNINNKNYQNELLSIYAECISIESQYLQNHPEYPKKISAAYYKNGEMLEFVFAKDKEEFLTIFEILSKYPPECYLGNIGNAIDLLFQIPTSLQTSVNVIFDNLVKRDPNLYLKKQQWEKTLHETDTSFNL